MSLTDREKEQLKAMIDGGQLLPPRYKAILFDQPHEAELIWPGKTSEVTNVVLPFQSIEQIDEPRAGTHAGTTDLFAFDQTTGRQTGGWSNKLIWGDNKLILASLKNGPLRRYIEDAGGLKLVYIDPPFDIGADFSFDIEIGDSERVTKESSVIEELAYRDTWGRGADSYLSMIYERLQLIHGLMAPDASIYVHIGPEIGPLVKVALDEIFGRRGQSAEITWKRVTAHGDSKRWGVIHDYIYWKTKSDSFIWNPQFEPYSKEYLDSKYNNKAPDGRLYRLDNITSPNPRPNMMYTWRGNKAPRLGWRYELETMERLHAEGRIEMPKQEGGRPQLRRFLDEMPGVPVGSVWADINPVNSQALEDTGYDTQKPESLLNRIIRASSREGDLVAVFFCGSGTTLAVAEKLGRKWIGTDLGRYAIHTSRKRMIGVQRELQEAGKPYRSFEILNLGKYERQYFAGIDPTLPEEQRRAISIQKEEHYLTLILSAYKAERVFQSPPFHGKKAGALIVVGPIDAPVTQSQVHEAVEAARKLRISKLDILGFEFEMGLVPHAQDEARAKGVNVALRYIPKDVFDRRAIDRGQVVFYDVAYVDVQPVAKGTSVTVKLKDFGVYYRQDDVQTMIESLKNGGSKVTIESGQVVKIVKDKKGVVTREVLTKAWTDWVDYWAVDFDFENRKEIVRIAEADGSERKAWTGGYIFENEWQSFRTRQERTLELTSVPHAYAKKGRYKIAVKVIDIFGNDTTKVVEVVL